MNPRILRRFVALGLVAAFLAAGCSSTMRDAATVRFDGDDGERVVHISRGEIEDELRHLLDSGIVPGANDVVDEATGETTRADDGVVSNDVTAQWMQLRIYQAAFEILFDERALTVDDDLRDDALASVTQQFGGEQQFGEFPQRFRDDLTRREAMVLAVLGSLEGAEPDVAEPTDAEAREFFEENRDAIGACPSGKEVSHILVETEEEAEAARAELEGGADFADLARERSIDPSAQAQGGSLGCLGATPFVAEFQEAADAAPLDEVVGPVETQFGFHLVLVTEHAEPTFEEYRDQIVQHLRQQAEQEAGAASQAALGELLTDFFDRASVDLDARYGTWTSTDGQWQVVPPVSPEPRAQREPDRTVPLGGEDG